MERWGKSGIAQQGGASPWGAGHGTWVPARGKGAPPGAKLTEDVHRRVAARRATVGLQQGGGV